VRPEAPDAATVLQILPGSKLDMTLAIRRGNEIVATLIAAVRELMIARQLQAHSAQQSLMLGRHLQLLGSM
jgi:hypothetical protein